MEEERHWWIIREDFNGPFCENHILPSFIHHWPHPIARKTEKTNPCVSSEKKNKVDETIVSGTYSVF